MSIRKFLSDLDSEQLQVAINVANEFLKEKTAGEKVRVTVVSSSAGRKSFFDRDKAKAFFIEVAEKESECIRPELELYTDFIYESELLEHFSEEEVAEYKSALPK